MVSTLIAFTISAALVNVPILFRFRALLMPWRPDRILLKRYWSFSWPLLLSAPMAGIIGWIDLFIINHYCRIEDVGRYFLSLQIHNAITQISFIVSLISAPFLILINLKKRHDLTDLLANRLSWFVIAFGVMAVLLLTPAACLIFGFIDPPHASQMIAYWLILSPGAIYGFSTMLICNHYVARDTILPITIFNAIRMLVGVIVSLLLVPRIGPIGAAIAGTTGQTVLFIIMTLDQRRFGLVDRQLAGKVALAFLPGLVLFALLPYGLLLCALVSLFAGLIAGVFVVRETLRLMKYQADVATT